MASGPGFPDSNPPPAVSLKPLMSYTRFFDGADPEDLDALRRYYLYRNDLRSGGWEAYLHRSDDFIRFAMHLTITEMLTIHGGVLRTQYVRKYWK